MKINYQIELEKIITNNIKNNVRPTLLLHSCCGPCSSYVLTYLNKYFTITVFYYNPNIYPSAEFIKRKNEQVKLINKLNLGIEFIEGIYEDDIYNNFIKGLEEEKEGGNRCFRCYELRLEKTALLAKNKGFDYFSTTLSVSPYKNSDKLNEIGRKLEEKHNIKYLYADFKKKDGYKKSIVLSKEYNLYRQEYCGCKYSINKVTE